MHGQKNIKSVNESLIMIALVWVNSLS